MTFPKRKSKRAILASISVVVLAILLMAFTATSAMASPTQPQNERDFNTSLELEEILRESGFISFIALEDLDGTVHVSGIKLGQPEAVAISLQASLDNQPWSLASQQGTATNRMNDVDQGEVFAGSKLTIKSDVTTSFVIDFTPPSKTSCAEYRVHVASASEEGWLLSIPVPKQTSSVEMM